MRWVSASAPESAPITPTLSSGGGEGYPGSAGGRRLIVLGVGDVLAPGGALTLLAGFRQGEMREQALGRGAVPMHRVGRDVDDIAGVQHLRLLALKADAADATEAIER